MRLFAITVLLLLCSSSLVAAQRDPLTEAEADQLRQVAQNPELKLKLYIQFASARLLAIQQLRADPKLAKDRGPQIHDLLEDFSNLVDEADSNVADFKGKHADREKQAKGLKALIQAEDDWKLKLRTLKEADGDAVEKKERKDHYEFVLTTAIETVNDSASSNREDLENLGMPVPEEKKKK